MLGLLMSAIGLFSVSSAQDDDRWVRAARTRDFVVYIDVQTLRPERTNGHVARVTTWQRQVYVRPQTSAVGERYNEALIQQIFDCDERTSTIIGWVFRNGDEVMETVTLPRDMHRATAVAPGTVDEGLFDFVCPR